VRKGLRFLSLGEKAGGLEPTPGSKNGVTCFEATPVKAAFKLRSEDDAAPEPRVPAEASTTYDRRGHDHGRSYNHGRDRRNDDRRIRLAAPKGTAVKANATPSSSLNAERCQG
jgi:hypothetical protein